MDLALLVARLVLALVFALAAMTKLLDRAGSRHAVTAFGVPEVLAAPVSIMLPVAELAVAIALVPSVSAWWGAGGALLLLLLFIGGISFNLARGETPDCHCFGQLYSEPIGIQTVVRNAVLALIAVFVLVAGYGHPGTDVFRWLETLSGTERLAVGIAGLAVAAAASQWWLLLHPPVWLAERLPMLVGSMVEKGSTTSDAPHNSDHTEGPQELPVGSHAPRFRLPGLHGETMTLDALRAGGRAVILIFVSPSCGPCNALMPDLARWQVEYAGALRFVLISSGTVEDNRAKAGEHGVVDLLVQKTFEVGSAYQMSGTPGAVIVYPNGTIGSPVANGPDQIRALLDQYIELLAAEAGVELEDEGEMVRAMTKAANPLQIGSSAADLQFLDQAGNTVRLNDIVARETALLFWNPTCSYCQQLEPSLQAWEADRPEGAPDVALILSEPLAEGQTVNLRSRILIDRDSVAGNTLHSGGTPTAVLIDANGTIASQPAVGADAISPILRLRPIAPEAEPIPLLDWARARSTRPAPPGDQRADDPFDYSRDSVLDRPVLPPPTAPVQLMDFRGRSIDLTEFRGRETVLLFWDTACGFCDRMLPDLRSWEDDAPPGAPRLVIIVPGSAASSQIVSFKSDVMIDRNGNTASAFGASGTPMAVRLRADGTIGSALAAGASEVFELLAPDPVPLATGRV